MRWVRRVPHIAEVVYEDIQPGADLVFYGNAGHLDYGFVPAPGADPKGILLQYEGAAKWLSMITTIRSCE